MISLSIHVALALDTSFHTTRRSQERSEGTIAWLGPLGLNLLRLAVARYLFGKLTRPALEAFVGLKL